MPLHRRCRRSLALIAMMSVLVACTTTGTPDTATGTVSLTTPSMTGSAANSASAAPSSVTPTPVTPLGFAAGPGVSDGAISLGLFADNSDGGFGDGVRLWQEVVNNSGGLCGRTIDIVEAADYATTAPDVAGFLMAAGDDRTAEVGTAAAADALVVLTDTAARVGSRTGIIPVGATSDILVINTLAQVQSSGLLAPGSVLGLLSDGSIEAAAALTAARWWAGQHGVLVVEHPRPPVSWDGAEVVIAWNSPASVRSVQRSAPQATVITDAIGFDPDDVPTDPEAAGRLVVALVTPSFGSDHPATAMVSTNAASHGLTIPGSRVTAGYAVAGQWARILLRACESLDLSRPGIVTAMAGVGPATPDSLLGPADPEPAALGTGPATTVSSVAAGHHDSPTGLQPLTWLMSAPDLGDYLTG